MGNSRQAKTNRSNPQFPASARSRFAPRPFSDETDTIEANDTNQAADAQPNVQTRSPFPPVNLLTIPTYAPTPVAPVQAKLTIGEPGDQYEQEADRTAAQVMRMPDPAPPVQREPLSEEEEALQTKPIAISSVNGASLQQKCSECEQEQVQRSSEGTAEVGSDIESQLNSSKGGGSPLSDDVRSFMEPRFGADFSAVRTHTGGAAVQMSEAIGAQAFTHGNDIYFGAGKSPANSDLTAHELTHVVQQTGALKPIAQTKIAQTKTEVVQRVAAAVAAPAVVFGPVGLAVAVGIAGVTITVLWLNNGGWEEIGRITDAIGKGINGILEELESILDRAGEGAQSQLRRIEEYIREHILMSSRGRGTPGNNQAQNRQFNDAVREIERRIGRRLSRDEIRRLHDAISGQDYDYHDIVEEGIGMFGS